MKKAIKFSISVLLLAFAFLAFARIGSVSAATETLKEDLDGDGIKETIEWVITEDEENYISVLESFTINGKDVYKASKVEKPLKAGDIDISIIDTATKDSFREIAVCLSVDATSDFYLFRYNNGKITKYAFVESVSAILSQKTKKRIKAQTYVNVMGIGNVFVTEEYKVKSGKISLVTKIYKPDKRNDRKTFKTNQKLTVYMDSQCSEEAGVIKSGSKIKLDRFMKDDAGRFTLVYIKNTSTGVEGWINTEDYDYSEFFIENPPLWN